MSAAYQGRAMENQPSIASHSLLPAEAKAKLIRAALAGTNRQRAVESAIAWVKSMYPECFRHEEIRCGTLSE